MYTTPVRLEIIVGGGACCGDHCRWQRAFKYNDCTGYHCILFNEFLLRDAQDHEVHRCRTCMEAEFEAKAGCCKEEAEHADE